MGKRPEPSSALIPGMKVQPPRVRTALPLVDRMYKMIGALPGESTCQRLADEIAAENPDLREEAIKALLDHLRDTGDGLQKLNHALMAMKKTNMPEIEMSEEQLAARAYERWVTAVRESDGAIAQGVDDAFLAGWQAGRDFQDGWTAGLAAAKAAETV
jgi:hypothetical protein